MQFRSARKLLPSLLLLPLAACSKDSLPQVIEPTKLLDAMPRVENSLKSPCWQQHQIAKQQSYLATVKAGKETVIAAACKEDKPKATS